MYFEWIIKTLLNSSFVWCEELCRARRMLSTGAEGLGGKHPPDLHNSSHPTYPLSILLIIVIINGNNIIRSMNWIELFFKLNTSLISNRLLLLRFTQITSRVMSSILDNVEMQVTATLLCQVHIRRYWKLVMYLTTARITPRSEK